MNKSMRKYDIPILSGLVLFAVSIFAGYFTHIIWSIKLLMAATEPTINQAVLMILGIVIPIIGAIHGFILWF